MPEGSMAVTATERVNLVLSLEDNPKQMCGIIIVRQWFDNGAYSSFWQLSSAVMDTLRLGATWGTWSHVSVGEVRFKQGDAILFRLWFGGSQDVMRQVTAQACAGYTVQCDGLDRNYRTLKAAMSTKPVSCV